MNEIIVIAGYLVIFISSEYLYRGKVVSQETARKLTHILSGMLTIFVPYLISFTAIFIIGIVFAISLFLIKDRDLFNSICKSKRKTYGSWLMPLAIGLTAYLFKNDTFVFQLAVCMVTFADSFAAILGNTFPSRIMHFFDSQKTIVGTISFFCTALLICITGFTLLNSSHVLGYAVLSSVVLTVIEFFSIRGTDNITVMIAAAYLFSLLS